MGKVIGLSFNQRPKVQTPGYFCTSFFTSQPKKLAHNPPAPMQRLSIFILFTILSVNTLNAQSGAPISPRLTSQQLSPAEAALQKETAEVEQFARKLALLKTAFAEKDASKIVAHESALQLAMRNEVDQWSALQNSGSGAASKSAKARLKKMSETLAAFDGHAFDPAQPEAAKRDFAALDAFLKWMQEALREKK